MGIAVEEERLRGGMKVYLLWVQEATKKPFWYDYRLLLIYLIKRKGMLKWGLACNIEKCHGTFCLIIFHQLAFVRDLFSVTIDYICAIVIQWLRKRNYSGLNIICVILYFYNLSSVFWLLTFFCSAYTWNGIKGWCSYSLLGGKQRATWNHHSFSIIGRDRNGFEKVSGGNFSLVKKPTKKQQHLLTIILR